MNKKYHGIIPPVISPVDKDENIDVKGYKALLDYCIKGGLHGIFVAGTNGETMALTQRERNRIIEVTLEHIDGRVPVIAGAMDSSTRRVIENIREIERMGGECAAVTPIFYDRHTSQEETVRHFEKILEKTSLELIIYNIPAFTGIKLNADTVIKNAENAYKTAGMSANDYMSTVTSFSASLLQSLGGDTAAAAKSADMAIIDMADNANKMGTSMESIQWAYQGFAKQNYTMLDNLKLGYGGTKEEMERLLADAQKLTGVKYDITNLNDVYNAIHVIQGELGITGTTAKEASETITGSISSMKAAFDNFLNGSGTIDQLVQTGITSIQNIVSAVGKLLPNLVQSVADATPQIVAGINQIFPQILNLITQNAPTILNSIGQVLMALVQSLMDYMPQLMTIAMQLIQSFINGLISMLPQIIQMGVQLITQLITGIAQMLPQLIPQAVQCIVTIVTGLLNNIDQIIDAGLQLIMGLVQGLINAVPQLINAIPSIITGLVNGIVNNLPKIIEAGIQLVLSLATGLIQAIPQLVMAIPQIVGAILQGLWELPGKIWEILVNIVTNFINWGLEIQAKANESVTGLVTNVINWFKELPRKYMELVSTNSY